MSLFGDLSNTTLGGNFYSNDSTPWDRSFRWPAYIILSFIITALIVLLGVPGNGAVVWVTGFKMTRNVHTVLFLNLAVADLIYCLILPFLAATFVEFFIPPNIIILIILSSAVTFNMSASIFLLTLISICRCLSVTRPIWFHQHLRLAWVRAACVGAWVLAFVMSLPYLLVEQILPYLRDNTITVLELTWVVFTFGLPVVIMAICYLLIVRELRKGRFSQSRKPVRLIVTVVAVFIICWLPNTLCRLFRVFSQGITLDLIVLSYGLASFNSALNPLLYVFVGREFRQVFRRSLVTSLQLTFAEEGVRVGKRPSVPLSQNLGRETSPDDGEGGRSAATGDSPLEFSVHGSPLPLHRRPGAESVPQSVQNIERCSTGTRLSAHPLCADHDANLN